MLKMIDIKYEKMLFYNDLLEYQVSIEGKRVDNAFKLDDMEHLKECIDTYYTARNYTGLHYDNEEERESAKRTDKYISDWYCEMN
jgi:hypothetical protein